MAVKVVNTNTEMGASGADHCSGVVPDPGSTAGTNKFLREDATFQNAVQSAALAMPAEFTVSGSPITTSGTFTVAKASEAANTVWAGPTTGSAAAPTFRILTSTDIPAGFASVSFGTGAPTGTSTTGYIYFNTSTTPYTGYVYNGGWQQFS